MSLQPGSRFGRYELVSQLGRGGMAETYRARLLGEAGVTKPVLIKKVLPEYANDEAFTTMFISEARISATLSHGNIAQVYDFGRVDEEYFLAMEFVDGQPLNRLLKRSLRTGAGAIPVPIATYIGIEMCRGLHYAHSRTDESGRPLGIVHRDISPDNVLISYEGQVKIVDFGIAKARELRGFNTEPGVVKGKFLYFSPEQARGKEVDARTDVWATGVVLYYLVCGRLPVEGQQHVAVPRLMKGEFPRPRELNPELPEELDDILMQALTVDRRKRLESCHELGNALTGFLYSAEPRFSGMALSHFVQQMFRQDLSAEGRQVQVPRSFLEQMTRWQQMSAPSQPVSTPVRSTSAPTRSVRPSRASQSARPEPPAQGVQAEPEPEQAALATASTRKALVLGLGGGAVLMAAAGVLFFVAMGEPRLQAPGAGSSPVPLAPSVAGGVVPTSETIPVPGAATAAATGTASRASSPSPPSQRPPAPARTESPEVVRARGAYADALKLFEAKQYKEAVIEALLCIEFDSKNADCQKLAGDAHAALEEPEKAVERYQAFLRLAPEDPRTAEVERTVARLSAPPPEDTSSPAPEEAHPAASVRRAPVSTAAREQAKKAYDSAMSQVRYRRFKEAAVSASRCLSADPGYAECHMLLGAAYIGTNRWEQAAAEYRKFLELAPDHPQAPRVRMSLERYEMTKSW